VIGPAEKKAGKKVVLGQCMLVVGGFKLTKFQFLLKIYSFLKMTLVIVKY